MKRSILLAIALTLSANSYAELPPEIQLDSFLLQAKTALDNNDYDAAIQSLKNAEQLNVPVPETFYFHFGKAYAGLKKWDEARRDYEHYLQETGTKGKFYKEALEGFNQADSMRTTQGSINYTNGAKYVGELSNGKPNGQGTYIRSDGGKYVGEFKDGKLHGKATWTGSDGYKYVGEFKNGAKEGKGIMYSKDGSKSFEGEFKNGVKEGNGTFYLENGRYQEGSYENDKLEGTAATYRSNGSVEYYMDYSNDKSVYGSKVVPTN